MVVNKLCLILYFWVNCPIVPRISLTPEISNLLEKYPVFKLVFTLVTFLNDCLLTRQRQLAKRTVPVK